MMNLIPAQWRMLAAIAAVAALCGLAAAGGAVVGTWKADAGHAAEVQELTGQIGQLRDDKHQLELAIAEQNKGVAVAEAQTRAAEQAQAQAQQHAADLALFSQARLNKLEQTFKSATSCGEVLDSYWELRR